MALQAPTNPDLPSSWYVPGVYIKLNLSGSGAGLNSPTKKLLLMGYRLSTGTQAPDTPVQITQQSDANTYFGQGSQCARLYASAVSQVGPGTCDIYVCGVNEPSGGTASTHLITFIGTATAAGFTDIWICGYKISVAIANGDTATTIATNASTAINLVKDLPVTAGAASGSVTLTARHKGVSGNDLPTIVNLTGATGITASPGTITFAGSATASGTITLTVGTTAISYTVTNGDANTVTSAGLAAAINAGAYPVTASEASGVVTLLYATDRVVHRISLSMGTVATQTGTPAVGTTGAGTPTLTTALSNIAGQSTYNLWATGFNDSTSLGTLSTHIELYANGLYQKGQTLHVGSNDSLTIAGALPTSSSPQLTASPRYVLDWCQDSPQQAYELAARTAAMVCVEDYVARNFDGAALVTRGTVPLMLPHKNSRPDLGSLNSAMYSYHMTPLYVDEASGVLRVMRGMTTANDPDQRLYDWSWVRTLDYYRYDLGTFLTSRFQGKSFKPNGTPHTANTINTQSVADAMYERLRTYDFADLFDDVESVKSSIQVNQDPIVPSRIDVFVPMRPPVNLHQLGIVGGTNS